MAELHPRSWQFCAPDTTIVLDDCQEIRRMGSKPLRSCGAEVRTDRRRARIYLPTVARGPNYRRGTPTHRARARSGGGEHRTQERGRSGTSTVGFVEGVGSVFMPSAGTPKAVN